MRSHSFSADQLTFFCRLHSDLHRSSCFRPLCDYAYDDYKSHREANSQRYLVLTHTSNPNFDLEQAYLYAHANTRSVPSSSLRVGDLVLLEKDQRVPADMILLHTSDSSGTGFIRTDQLDGDGLELRFLNVRSFMKATLLH